MSDEDRMDARDGDLNAAAQALGRMGKGVRKQLSDEERARRAERMRSVTAQRVAKRATMHQNLPLFNDRSETGKTTI